MKKTFKILTIATAIATLVSCGGTTTQQQNGAEGADGAGNAGGDVARNVSTDDDAANTVSAPIDDVEETENIAYEVSKLINPQTPKEQPSDTADKREYSFGFEDEEHYDLEPVATTRCMRHADGGYIVIYQEKEEGVLGDGYVEYIGKFDVYLYKDGKLTPKQDLLPKPTFANFEAQDALIMMGHEQDIASFISRGEKFTYELVADKKLAVCTNFESDYTTVYYNWNGRQFVQCTDCETKRSTQIISGKGLGKILVGDDAPGDIKGFNKEKIGNNVTYSRLGKKYFSLALSSNNKIDTITVHTWLYSFPMAGLWGDSYYRVGDAPVDDCFGDESNRTDDYFIFTNGTWVRRVEIDGGMIDFVTTPKAIKDVKGTEGKIIKHGPPSFEGSNISDRDEKVTIIKIYGTAGFCESCAKLSDQQKTDKIRKMYYAIENDSRNLTKKHLEIEDPESGYPCDYNYYYKDGNLVMVEFSTGDGTMVNKKIYIEDGYPYFCFAVTTYPDKTKNEERIYMCAGKIYKFLDNSKKELNVNTDDAAVKAQASINSIITTAKDNESKAK